MQSNVHTALFKNIRRLLPVTLIVLVLGVFSLQIKTEVTAAQEPTPPPDGQIQLPTATPTLVGGPSATPSRTPTQSPVLAEAIGEANLRAGPGLDFDVVGQITAGNPIPVIGRSFEFPWYQVAFEGVPEAWVFEQLVTIAGDISTVPVVDAPNIPTIDPVQLSIEQTATIIIQTPGAAETATAAAFSVPTGVFTQAPDQPEGVSAPPTFTAAPPINQIEALPEQGSSSGPVPPAAVIVTLAVMGVLSLSLGLLRRITT